MTKETKPVPLKLSNVPYIQTGQSTNQYIEKLKEFCVTFHSEVKDIQFNSDKEKASYFMWLMINSNSNTNSWPLLTLKLHDFYTGNSRFNIRQFLIEELHLSLEWIEQV